jgi:hypothetical protein
LSAEIQAKCAAVGVRCELRTRGEGTTKKKALILTVPDDLSAYALEGLNRWIYVRVGTRPHDLSEPVPTPVDPGESMDAIRANNAWTSREFEFIVGRLVQTEFLDGVGSLCGSTGARWEWHVKRNGLARRIVVTLSGPAYVVDETATRLLSWENRFAPQVGA